MASLKGWFAALASSLRFSQASNFWRQATQSARSNCFPASNRFFRNLSASIIDPSTKMNVVPVTAISDRPQSLAKVTHTSTSGLLVSKVSATPTAAKTARVVKTMANQPGWLVDGMNHRSKSRIAKSPNQVQLGGLRWNPSMRREFRSLICLTSIFHSN